MNLCDPNTVKALLARHGFRFSKKLGQNFLIDQSVPDDIAALCGASQDTGVFEIGPGIGTLTARLAERAGHVLAFEIDRALLPVLDETLAAYHNNTKIIHTDVMKTDIAAAVREHLPEKRLIACANLPYYVTTPVITRLIAAGCFESVTVMVQKEVALRMAASAGTPDYGAFSVYIQYHAAPEIVLHVPSTAFVPQPKVDSAVVRLTLLSSPPFPVVNETLYFSIVRAAFSKRRKTLVNALSGAPGIGPAKQDLAAMIASLGFAADIRGERFSPADFASLTNGIANYSINS